jgi:hypothetical protein
MSSVSAFTIEAWTYLAIDIVVVATRVIARWWQLGIRDMKPDDFLMVIAIVSAFCNSFFHRLR